MVQGRKGEVSRVFIIRATVVYSSTNWWLRSANTSNSNNVMNVNSDGNVNNNNAYNSNGAAPIWFKVLLFRYRVFSLRRLKAEILENKGTVVLARWVNCNGIASKVYGHREKAPWRVADNCPPNI